MLDLAIAAFRELAGANRAGTPLFNVRLDGKVDDRKQNDERWIGGAEVGRDLRIFVQSWLGGLDLEAIEVIVDVARRHGADVTAENHGLSLEGFTGTAGGTVVVVYENMDGTTGFTAHIDPEIFGPGTTVGNLAYRVAMDNQLVDSLMVSTTLSDDGQILDPTMFISQLDPRRRYGLVLARRVAND